MKPITKYFRDSVASSSLERIDFKNDFFIELCADEIYEEKLKKENFTLFSEKETFGKDDFIPVLITIKTFSNNFIESQKITTNVDNLTSLLFLPAKLDKEGNLLLGEDNQNAWIPREFLFPTENPEIIVGNMKDYDKYLEDTVSERENIESFRMHFKYALQHFEYVREKYDDEDNITFETKFFMFKDNTVDAKYHVLSLYDHLMKKDNYKLYNRITNLEVQNSKFLLKNDIEKMKQHKGQMNGSYPLSPSQREAVNHFGEMETGDVLAVKGPPGTGKTTLLQSIVADMYVSNALERKEAPIIVASSTNNQAVTNIIDSFGKIDKMRDDCLEERWITDVVSFATYFPSGSKKSEAKEKGYQYTDVRGNGFISKIESKENRESSKELFLEKYNEFFSEDESKISICKSNIHRSLKNVENDRLTLLTILGKVKSLLGEETYEDFINRNIKSINNLKSLDNNCNVRLKELQDQRKTSLARVEMWKKNYNDLKWYVRIFNFIPSFKNEVKVWIESFLISEELLILNSDMSINEIIQKLLSEIEKINVEVTTKTLEQEKIMNSISQKEKDIFNLNKVVEKAQMQFEQLKYMYALSEDQKPRLFEEINIDEVNNILDELRYIEFWLSVHYYEARWLDEEYPLTISQMSTTYEENISKRYKRLAMISPCFVMTFFMLPKQFFAYDGNTKRNFYMYNFIDLLIVDEAGQISPEIAACSFSLAKKALVVGDEHQISPVWNTPRAVDISLAIQSGIISKRNEFNKLQKTGLNCSESNLMKISSNACYYEKYGKGLFLSEHRRCFDEIIEYSNILVYDGNLEPLRGTSDSSNNKLNGILPSMGNKYIQTTKSEKVGGSRRNNNEANVIATWILEMFPILLEKYEKEAPEQILGIITPFKSQSNLIKNTIRTQCGEFAKYISVGTVHTFQGAERNVIIFSSVYGSEDGNFFINANDSLMNVAVSRAKDSFLVFGDYNCLKGDVNSPSSLLRKMTKVLI